MQSIDENTRKLNRLTKAVRGSLVDFQRFEIDTKVELIRALIALGLMAVGDMLEAEVVELAGSRYRRGGEHRRYGSNPGTVKLQGQRHRMRVPRVRDRHGNEVGLQGWAGLRGTGEPDEVLLRRVLYGLSCRKLRRGGRGTAGGDRVVGLDGVAQLHRGEPSEAQDVSRARPLEARPGGAVLGREDLRRGYAGCCPRGDDGWAQSGAGLRADRDRERTRAHALPGWCGGSGRGALPRAAGHYRWGQRAARSGANGVRQTSSGATVPVGTSARMWCRIWRRISSPSGAGACNTPMSVRLTRRRTSAWSRSHKELTLLNESAAASLREGVGGDAHPSPPEGLSRTGPELQDHELSGIAERRDRATLCQSRSLEDLEPEASLDGSGVARHRTPTASHPRLPASDETASGAEARTASGSAGAQA